MSFQAMSDVLNYTQHGGSAQVMLIMLANEVDALGICSPEMGHLAVMSRLNPRQARRVLAKLIESGELREVPSPDPVFYRGRKCYRIVLEGAPCRST